MFMYMLHLLPLSIMINVAKRCGKGGHDPTSSKGQRMLLVRVRNRTFCNFPLLASTAAPSSFFIFPILL